MAGGPLGDAIMKLTCILLLTLVTFGCGTYNNMNPAPGAVSVVSQIMPTSAPAGGSGFVLTVDGMNFGMGSVIYWNSVAHNATYLTGQQITTMIAASEVANPGSVPVYVRTNGQNSNTIMFMIKQ